MKRLIQFLQAIRLFDQDGVLSLTNIAMMVVIYKIATATNMDWAVLTGFFLALMNYNVKKLLGKKESDQDLVNAESLTKVQDQVKSLSALLLRK